MKKPSLLARWNNRKNKVNKVNEEVTSVKKLVSGLSSGQERLWFLQQLQPDNPFYNYADAYRFYGNLDTAILIKCFQVITERHSILRTTFSIEHEKAVQKIQDKVIIPLQTIDLRHLPPAEKEAEANRLAIEFANQSFDLAKGPLLNISLIQLAKEEHLLVLNMHHIITDKWSMKILREELSVLYNHFCYKKENTLAPIALQYIDFSDWRKKQDYSKSLAYWEEKLAGDLPVLNLPTDHLRPVRPSHRGAYHRRDLPVELFQQLDTTARAANVTLFVILLAAFKVLLYRYTNQTDLLVGTPITNRDQVAFERLIGFFNDTLVLRSDLSNEPTFMDLLAQVRTTTLDAFSNKNTPFETLVKKLKPQRQLSTSPIFQVMFLFHEVPPTPSFGEELTIKHTPFDFGVAKFDFTLYISVDKGELSTTFEYATDLFEESTIERVQEHFQTLLTSIVTNPKQAIGQLAILPKAENELVVSTWNDTAVAPINISSIHHLIEKQAIEKPNQIALVFEKESLTYQALNEKADKVARYLIDSEGEGNTFVGLCAARSLEMIIGLVGILKAGKAYVPLDPEYPKERLAFIAEDAQLSSILIQDDVIGTFAEESIKSIPIKNTLTANLAKTPLPVVKENDTAYMIYTSGSTGKPKGVVVTHKNLIHSTCNRAHFYPESPSSFLLLSSFAFDSSIVGIFWTLCTGGKLVLPTYRIEQDLEALGELVRKQLVTHTLLVPSLYTLLLQHIPNQQLETLTSIVVAGEACSASLCRQHFTKFGEDQVKLYNEYGPTEASVWCIAHEIKLEDTTKVIPIGKPISNTQIYLLDDYLQPVPVGIIGEIYVGGDGITKGYWNRPTLTAERFIVNPFSNENSNKLYKTGDLGKYRLDGTIDFIGRKDSQVKIRGYRIELEEIRELIKQHPDVKESVVMIQQQSVIQPADADELMTLLSRVDTNTAIQLLETVATLPAEKVALMIKTLKGK